MHTDAVVCYSCNDLPHPADCGNIVQCGEHEVCIISYHKLQCRIHAAGSGVGKLCYFRAKCWQTWTNESLGPPFLPFSIFKISKRFRYKKKGTEAKVKDMTKTIIASKKYFYLLQYDVIHVTNFRFLWKESQENWKTFALQKTKQKTWFFSFFFFVCFFLNLDYTIPWNDKRRMKG